MIKINNQYFLILALVFCSYNYALSWRDITKNKFIYLYAGNIPTDSSSQFYKKAIGLSLTQNNSSHIKHNVLHPIPLPNNCVDIYQSEDVFEHIEYNQLTNVINEIYRILKPGGLLRISMPDYRSDILYNRSIKDKSGKIIFDPFGGGNFQNGKVINGGHVWFPIIENVNTLLEKTNFVKTGRIEYLHYYNTNGIFQHNPINYSKGHIKRTPDHDERVKDPYRGLSIVIDLYK